MIPIKQNIYEKRLVNRLKTFWDRVKDENGIPLYSKFNYGSLHDIMDSCMTIRVITSGKAKIYHCDYVGDLLKVAFGKELEGRYFSSYDSSGTLNRQFLKLLDYAVDNADFVLSEGQFVNKKSEVVKYRDCVMPFRNHKNQVHMVVIGVSWRVFS